MKIIYGVAGEGMGHAIRSSVIIENLKNKGHEVYIVSSGRSAKFLKQKFSKCIKINGFVINYDQNKVNKLKTVISNVKSAKKAIKGMLILDKLFKKFKPDLVITDFDTTSHYFAKINSIPVLAIDNIQSIDRCKIDKLAKTSDFYIAKAIVKAKTPKCNKFFITSFFDIEIKKKNTAIHHPVLRKEIIDAKDKYKEKDHILVYQTSDSSNDLIKSLKSTSEKFYVYGHKRDIKKDSVDGNIIHKPFSENEFIKDIASSKAVISGGSFTVMSECIYLQKPLLSVPIQGQYEQYLNSFYLEKMGFGKGCKFINSNIINSFINSIDFYKENLSDYKHDNNKKIFKDIDVFIGRIGGKTNNI